MKPLLDGGAGHARKIGCLSIICVQIYYKRISMIALCQVHFHNCVCMCGAAGPSYRSLSPWKRRVISIYYIRYTYRLTSMVREAVPPNIVSKIFSLFCWKGSITNNILSSKICTNRQSTTYTVYISSWSCYWLRNGKIRGATSVNC